LHAAREVSSRTGLGKLEFDSIAETLKRP